MSTDIRLAKIFGIKDSQEFPVVSLESLQIYHDYLKIQLVFSIFALYEQKIEPFKTTRWDIKVLGLFGIEFTSDVEFYGLFCEADRGRQKIQIPLADVEVMEKGNNDILIEDYKTWFWNNR